VPVGDAYTVTVQSGAGVDDADHHPRVALIGSTPIPKTVQMAY